MRLCNPDAVPRFLKMCRRAVSIGRNGACMVLLSGVVLLAGCDSPVTEAELVGRYLCKYPYGIELLVLRAEGRYTQIIDVDAKDGTQVHHGEWRYNFEERKLELVDALLVDDFFGKLNPDFATPAPGRVSIFVENTFHGLKLVSNPDLPYECHRW